MTLFVASFPLEDPNAAGAVLIESLNSAGTVVASRTLPVANRAISISWPWNETIRLTPTVGAYNYLSKTVTSTARNNVANVGAFTRGTALPTPGGGVGVLPDTTMLNVQSATGSWSANKAAVDAARAAGYRVYWVTDAVLNLAPSTADGLADGDVVNGGAWLAAVAPPETVVLEDDFGTTALTKTQLTARPTPIGGKSFAHAGTGTVSVNAEGHLVVNATSGVSGVDWGAGGLGYGKVELTIESFTGSVNAYFQLRGSSDAGPNSARGYINNTDGTYNAKTTVSNSADKGTAVAIGGFPAVITIEVTQASGVLTTTVSRGGTNLSTHSKTTSFGAQGNDCRLFVPQGGILTLSKIKYTIPAE